MLKIGGLAKINSVYADQVRDKTHDCLGTLVMVLDCANCYDYKVEVLEGEYVGSLWLFNKDELDAA